MEIKRWMLKSSDPVSGEHPVGRRLVASRKRHLYRIGYVLMAITGSTLMAGLALAWWSDFHAASATPRVAVVGDYRSLSDQMSLSSNIAMGRDVRKGAEAVFACATGRVKPSLFQAGTWPGEKTLANMQRMSGTRISLRFFDDHGDPDRARAVAMAAIFDPAIIGVIGHSRSETTRRAAPYYERAGMALLMPIATTTLVPSCTPRSEKLLGFRLPPSDSVQANLIASDVKDYYKANSRIAKKPCLILFTDDAYGRPLAHDIYKSLLDECPCMPPLPLEINPGTIDDLWRMRSDIGALVLCCYHREAAMVVAVNRLPSSPEPSTRPAEATVPDADASTGEPPIFMTDGCVDAALIPLVSKFAWKSIYFYFPSMLTRSQQMGLNTWIDNYQRFSANSVQGLTMYPSYSVYGCDAMIIMLQAINNIASVENDSLPSRQPSCGEFRRILPERLKSILSSEEGVRGLGATYSVKENSRAGFERFQIIPCETGLCFDQAKEPK